jgi:tRNA-Thr(GGU) m(6)t(6)A37 methyltransferase TsaA
MDEDDESPAPEPTTNVGGFTVAPIGVVASRLTNAAAAPRQADEGAPPATLVLDNWLEPALAGLLAGDEIVVLTWLHQARRNDLATHPRGDRGRPVQGVFSTRSPDRPNPIGLHHATITAISGCRVDVEHLEAIDGTPVLDIKPVLGPPEQR